jgi:hypothetical protein
MKFRKFAATQLFTGEDLLTDDHVLITDNEGTVQEIVQKEEAGRRYTGI